jgi:hypothetical protein
MSLILKKPSHWILRVADGVHFIKSQPLMRWGINSNHTNWALNFMRTVKEGDILWFVKKGQGQVLGVATFTYHCKRELGPLLAVTPTNEELGWTQTKGEWDTEVHYKDLYDVTVLNLLTRIKSPLVGRLYNEKCLVNLPDEYSNIVKYSKVTRVLPIVVSFPA